MANIDFVQIENVVIECAAPVDSPPLPPVLLELVTSSLVVNDTVAVTLTLSSEEVAVSGFQFTLVGLGCVEDVDILSLDLAADQGKRRGMQVVDDSSPFAFTLSAFLFEMGFVYKFIIVVVVAAAAAATAVVVVGPDPFFEESELIFSEQAATVAAFFIASGALPPGNYSLDIVVEPAVALPICVESVTVTASVRRKMIWTRTRAFRKLAISLSKTKLNTSATLAIQD